MKRPSAAARGYDRAWQRLRAAHLRDNPLCVMCERQGRLSAASIADHIVTFRRNGVIDESLRLDPNNLQSLCKPCHDSAKQAQDRRGRAIGCDVDGNPIAGWMA
jgi:5-methylcytosine-specific restriction enzyme A